MVKFINSTAFILAFLLSFTVSAVPLNVELTVKEVAGRGSSGFPVHSVVPLPYGKYQNTNSFQVVDELGNVIPAQFEVHNRWWAKDKSLRHVVIHFQPQVDAFTTAGTGQKKYWLKDAGGNISYPSTVSVNESVSKVTINTGATSFTINKAPFSIETPKGKLQAEFQFWDRTNNSTLLQKSFDRNDISIEVEENGPMRSVIKISAPTLYNSVNDHVHGWAVRLYAYAGKPFVKIDYQLQNSAKNATLSAPLYFKFMNLVLDTRDSGSAGQVKSVVVKKKEDLDLRGFISTGSTQAIIRNFTQMWPNGLDVKADGKLTIELWPEWGEKYYWDRGPTGHDEPVRKEADKYWLDDMQHVYKEVLLNFGTMNANELAQLADTFQYPPVVSLPVSWYADTAVTLDMGGTIPYRNKISTEDLRMPQYTGTWNRGFELDNDIYYTFGWVAFATDVYRKNRTNSGGGQPYAKNSFIATENPADYYQDLDFSIGELNMRPQWMAGYKHNNDQANLALTTNPYGGNSWRQHLGARLPTLDADYLSGSKQNGQPRDNQHGWFYHIENAYNLSANLWIKDWYTFVGEFRKTFLNNLDPFPDNSSRAMGHALNHAIQAYRVTGDISLLNTAVNVFINTTLSNRLNEVTGINRSFKDNTDGLDKEAAFQMGFLARSLIDLHEELDGGNQKIMDILTGFMEWNLTIGNFSYYIDITKTNLVDIPNKVANGVGVSKGTGFLLIDPQLWVASKLGRTDLVDHVNAYVSSGLNGGAKPFGLEYLKDWDGRFFGRLYTNHVLNGVTIGGDCDGVVGINLHDVICVSNEVLTPSGTSVGECDGIQGVDIRDVVCTLNKAVASEQSSR